MAMKLQTFKLSEFERWGLIILFSSNQLEIETLRKK